MFLAHWMNGHMTLFFCKQLDAPSIGTAVDGLYCYGLSLVLSLKSQNVVRFSIHMPPLTSCSALTLSPTLGAKICCIHCIAGTFS